MLRVQHVEYGCSCDWNTATVSTFYGRPNTDSDYQVFMSVLSVFLRKKTDKTDTLQNFVLCFEMICIVKLNKSATYKIH